MALHAAALQPAALKQAALQAVSKPVELHAVWQQHVRLMHIRTEQAKAALAGGQQPLPRTLLSTANGTPTRVDCIAARAEQRRAAQEAECVIAGMDALGRSHHPIQ